MVVIKSSRVSTLACCTGILWVILFNGILSANSISNISISQPFFNPTLGQTLRIAFKIHLPGSLTVHVLDRDGFITRTLARDKSVQAGDISLDWDGRPDDSTEPVPDESYSLFIRLEAGGKVESYFPANVPSEETIATVAYYDRQTGTLSYHLEKPSRVHIQAGTAIIDPVSKKPEGPVLITLKNREPKTAGTVIEQWNGFLDDGTYVPDLPNFAIAVAATALPENSIITSGNRKITFLETIAKRSGTSLFTFSVKAHHHHQGLTALEDISPPLHVKPINAKWAPSNQAWEVSERRLRLACTIDGPSAASFVRQPGRLLVFVNGVEIHQMKPTAAQFNIDVSLPELTSGIHLVAVNWGSDWGPATVDTFRLKKE